MNGRVYDSKLELRVLPTVYLILKLECTSMKMVLQITLTLIAFVNVISAIADVPKYKPSSRSPEALDITTNRYGYSQNAPNALEIGDTAPDFVVTTPNLKTLQLSSLASSGPTVIVFYRGHW